MLGPWLCAECMAACMFHEGKLIWDIEWPMTVIRRLTQPNENDAKTVWMLLPPFIREQWRVIGDIRPALVPMPLLVFEYVVCISPIEDREDFRDVTAQHADTRCVICGSCLFPEEVAAIPYTMFNELLNVHTHRVHERSDAGGQKGNAFVQPPVLLPYWTVPLETTLAVGFVTYPRATVAIGKGLSLSACEFCAKDPWRKHFTQGLHPRNLMHTVIQDDPEEHVRSFVVPDGNRVCMSVPLSSDMVGVAPYALKDRVTRSSRI